ncbi:PilZ domain-containing protein [Chloroflexota bacterium]
MSKGNDERRKQDRQLLTFFSRVVDRKTGRLVGYLADLTTGGALLIGEKPVGTDSTLHLRMDLPENFEAGEQLEFNATAMWCSPDDDPDFYKIGLRLSDIPWEDLAIIARVLNDYGFST